LDEPAPGDLIAVTGATGLVGRQVASNLAAHDRSIRLVVRNPQRVADGGRADVRQASGYGAFDEMHVALQGVHTLFLIPAAESADRVQQHRTAVDAALAAGVRRIVYLSFLGAAEDATFTLARDHWHTEQHIRAAGLPWTFLRMNLYMDSSLPWCLRTAPSAAPPATAASRRSCARTSQRPVPQPCTRQATTAGPTT